MKIYTKVGDEGTTRLAGGVEVGKDNIFVEAYGTLDELNTFVGLARNHAHFLNDDLIWIQKRLFALGTIFSNPKYFKALAEETPLDEFAEKAHVLPTDTEALEQKIDAMESKLAPLRHFILPSGKDGVCYLHVCRTICRRAERRVVAIGSKEKVTPVILTFLNRLSDYFFVASRFAALTTNSVEEAWEL